MRKGGVPIDLYRAASKWLTFVVVRQKQQNLEQDRIMQRNEKVLSTQFFDNRVGE